VEGRLEGIRRRVEVLRIVVGEAGVEQEGGVWKN
jgi:hypothetical protein